MNTHKLADDVLCIIGDAEKELAKFGDNCIDCVVTSPPYFQLRDYGTRQQIGMENTYQDYLESLLRVFKQVHRVVKSEGTVFVNIADSYATVSGGMGAYDKQRSDEYKSDFAKEAMNFKQKRQNIPEKSLIGIPSRFQISMIDLGFICRNEIIWHKPNAFPSSATDRFTPDFEKIFFFSKAQKYFFNQQFEPHTHFENRKDWGKSRHSKLLKIQDLGSSSIAKKRTPPNPKGRNMRTTWSFNTENYEGNHFAAFPTELPKRCILAGCPENGLVLDPFCGSGTTLMVAQRLGKRSIGVDINPNSLTLIKNRLANDH